jgi:hypothetical protein
MRPNTSIGWRTRAQNMSDSAELLDLLQLGRMEFASHIFVGRTELVRRPAGVHSRARFARRLEAASAETLEALLRDHVHPIKVSKTQRVEARDGQRRQQLAGATIGEQLATTSGDAEVAAALFRATGRHEQGDRHPEPEVLSLCWKLMVVATKHLVL